MERQALNVFRMRLLGAEVRPALVGQPHPQGRRQRGHARLGGHRRDHALLPRLGHGPAPVPVDGARAAPGASATRPASSAGAARRRRSRRRGRLRRRRVQRGRHLLGLRRHRRPRWSGSSRPAARRVGRRRPRRRPRDRTRYLMQDEWGQVVEAHSISAGLDYPGVGPEHAHLADIGRAAVLPGHRRRGASTPSACSPAPRASSRPSSRPTPWPG